MNFLIELRNRNALLYYFGWVCGIGGVFCATMTQLDDTIVLGINAWIKPMKFFFSIWIFSWTMGWYMKLLEKQRKVKAYSIMVVIVLIFEQIVITWQAANGRLSHFNIDKPLYSILFSLMGVAITILVVWTAYITYLFFKQKQFDAPIAYLWGIRIGLVLFIIFSFEGGMMAAQLSHTVGAPDGGEGLPVVNWSRQYGDLRVAHFFGMHSLQLLPLLGYFVFRKRNAIIVVGVIYFIVVMTAFLLAVRGIPLL
jgi:hypothetical protein